MEQTINPPDLDDLLAESRDVSSSTINCVQIGKLTKVNDDQTCEIEVQFLRRLADGTTKKYPPLIDCPFFVLQGGGAGIDMPITAGNYCLVLFNDRNIDDWWDTANVAVPADTRKHSISDGMALVGFNPRDKAFSFDGTNLRILGPTGSKIELIFKPNGLTELKNDVRQLSTLISELFTEIKDITTFGSPTIHEISAASKTKLTTLEDKFKQLIG